MPRDRDEQKRIILTQGLEASRREFARVSNQLLVESRVSEIRFLKRDLKKFRREIASYIRQLEKLNQLSLFT